MIALQPDIREDNARARKGVDRLREEHASGLSAHGASTVDNETTRGGTDGLGQAKRLSCHLLAVKIGVILVAAGCGLITELKRLLERSKRIETCVGYDGLSLYLTGSNNSTFKLFHYFFPPVICSRISSSV
jgi:hypothetical protein